MAALGAALAVLLAAVGAGLVLQWLDAAVRPGTSKAPERVPYLGGHPPMVHAWNRYHVRYYAYRVFHVNLSKERVR